MFGACTCTDGAGGAGGLPRCVPGASAACACTSGATGAQTPAPPPKEGGEQQQQRQRSPARPGVEAYPQAEFEKQLVGYRAAIEKGKKTAEALIKMIETKHMLTAAQRNTLLAIKPKT